MPCRMRNKYVTHYSGVPACDLKHGTDCEAGAT